MPPWTKKQDRPGPEQQEVDPYGDLPGSAHDSHQGDLGLSEVAQPPPYSVSHSQSKPARTAVLQQPEHSSYIASLEARSMPSSTSGYGGPTPDVQITAYNESLAVHNKSLTTAYLLAVSLGFLGVHHFYLGRPKFGTLYLLTLGLFGLGWLTDLCRLPSIVKRTNSRRKDPSNFFTHHEDRDVFYVYIMWLTFGVFGLHHYYLRRWKWAVLYTCTAGLFGIGWIVDAFRIPFLTSDTNKKLAMDRANVRERGPQLRKLTSAYLLWIPPMGFLGGHHYYLKQNGFGVLYTFTGGLFFLGWMADACRMPSLVRRLNKQMEEDFQKASEGKVVLKDKTKHLDDALVLHCNPFGFMGAAQFYLGRVAWGVAYLFTFGLFGIGWLFDLIRIASLVKEANQKKKTNDQVRIQYGPNTQIIVVTNGQVVAGADPGATSTPVVLPAVAASLPAAHPESAEQPPSYDSVMTETMGGATGGECPTTEPVTKTATRHGADHVSPSTSSPTDKMGRPPSVSDGEAGELPQKKQPPS